MRWFARDDAGEAYYGITGTSEKFSILGDKPKEYELTISLTDMATKQCPKGSRVGLGFRQMQRSTGSCQQTRMGSGGRTAERTLTECTKVWAPWQIGL